VVALKGQITSAVVDENDGQTEVKPPASERDENQQYIDGEIGAAKTAWEDAGKPAHAGKEWTRRFHVAAEDKAAVKQMIRRALTLHKVGATWYKDVKTEDGVVSVKLHLAPLPAKAPQANGANPPKPAADSPATGTQDVETPAGQPENAASGTRFGRSRR
jgi:hypothetical protein